MLFPSLSAFGWTNARSTDVQTALATLPSSATRDAEAVAGRVVRHDRGRWTLITEVGECHAELRSRLRDSDDPTQHPTVGDWVVATRRTGTPATDGPATDGRATDGPVTNNELAIIEAVLPRTSALERGAVGRATTAQTLAANIDVALVCVPGDAPPNPRRVERQLAMVWNTGATPVVVLTKADLGADTSWVHEVSMGASVVEVDAIHGDGLDALDQWLTPATTLVVLGPSGAGKSTLANALLGEDRLATGHVRSLDQRGRHTTTWRELVMLPGGALLIDTPGIREVELWDADDGLSTAFADVESFAAQCRFHDCAHRTEPGCAVREAIVDGELAEERFENWIALQRELAYQARRTDARLAAEEKKRWAAIHKAARGRSRP